MKKRTTGAERAAKMYPFGGYTEDDTKGPRRVKSVPAGYRLHKDYKNGIPGATYYIKESSTTTPAIKRTVPVKRAVSSGAAPIRRRISVPPTTSNTQDIVYIQPDPVVTPAVKPQVAFDGEPVYSGNKLAYLTQMQRRASAAPDDSGILNTSETRAIMHPVIPNTDQPNLDETYDIPASTYTNYFVGGSNRLQGSTDSLKTYRVPKLATGGIVDYKDMLGQVPGVLDSIIGLAEGTPNYSRQPIMNASTIRGMATPYSQFALGGEAGDEEQLRQLQALADEQGISIEELIQQLQSDEQDVIEPEEDILPEDEDSLEPMFDDEEEIYDTAPEEPDVTEEDEIGETFAYGGKAKIHIKPENRGKFTAYKKRTGKTTEEALHSKNPHVRKMAQFAKNAKKWKHAYGGHAGNVPIEVEGGEALETPDGSLHKAVGPSHANGGVDVNVPVGTKIYSDRVKIDGKTMQERKVNREKAAKRLEKLKAANPHDKLLQGSFERTMQVNQAEEAEDMALQEALNRSHNPNQYPYGTPWRGVPYPNTMPEKPFDPLAGTPFADPTLDPIPMARPSLLTSADFAPNYGRPTLQAPNMGVDYPVDNPTPIVENPDANPFTTGDYVGMAGNLFNAIAPIINTRNAANATHPTVNRYRGFGNEAIQANDRAQAAASTMMGEALTDIETASNTAKARNRNSASSVNTLRALDALTDTGTNKARVSTRDALTRQLLGLTAQRGQLTNARDQMEMSGQERADQDNQAKTDNYFSNLGANLVNAGTQAESLGRNLNTSHQNQVNANLIASMAKNPIKIETSTGKLVDRNMDAATIQRYLDLGYIIEDGKLVRP